MKKFLVAVAFFAIFMFAVPLLAEEMLMTRNYFDSWLMQETAPLEQKIAVLKSVFAEMEQTVKKLRSVLYTEVVIVVGERTALVDQRPVELDVRPVLLDGRTMVPVRFIGEAFGADFSWDGAARKVIFTLDDIVVELYIDNKIAQVNGNRVTLDAAPYIQNDRTLVPLRFVGEHMGAVFQWNAESQTVTIHR